MPLQVATIDKLAFGGNGVCRIDGKVCFVPFSCPGDELSLRITAQKKSYCTASIVEILIPSPDRTVPECSIFGACGGCNWQHISYPTQLQQKRQILAETLWRGARVQADLVDDVVAASNQYGYRSRLQFKVSVQNGKLRIGFYRQGSHHVEDVSVGCPIAAPSINKVLNCFRDVLTSYPDVESVTQLSVDAGDSGVIAVIHHKGVVTSKGRNYFIERSGDFGPCTGLFLKADNQPCGKKIWGSSDISYCMKRADFGEKPLVLSYPPGGFAQVHQLQNISMLSVIRRLGTFLPTERLLDLYCGNGNFSIPLAFEVASVVGIEGSADSIRAAEYNKELNSVANIQFFCDDAASGVRKLAEQGMRFDTVLLDPPRSGAGDAVSGIVSMKPDKIIYVSCDPNTLARDCGLLSGFGYSVVRTVPIDMFPQTYHLESVTLLCRS
ncbi:MAG: class I SAM-dependent RNA methyltransferase [Geobacteraceae bacterium]|nr:class I SAM-dependent RNA methyltransferase [Geobacteraceae bacterium]NTW79054.1 class I SAM-dependent RNA methyltransferase [Geobacteraceae bacterium]